MAGRKKRDEITEPDITGLKYFDRLAPLLERLHDDGCARDKAGNRLLHYDQYCLLVLLFLFNPIVTSLRGLQQASALKKVQKRLGCARAALGSLSEEEEKGTFYLFKGQGNHDRRRTSNRIRLRRARPTDRGAMV